MRHMLRKYNMESDFNDALQKKEKPIRYFLPMILIKCIHIIYQKIKQNSNLLIISFKIINKKTNDDIILM